MLINNSLQSMLMPASRRRKKTKPKADSKAKKPFKGKKEIEKADADPGRSFERESTKPYTNTLTDVIVKRTENENKLILEQMHPEELMFVGEEGPVNMYDKDGDPNPLFFFLRDEELSSQGIVCLNGIEERFSEFMNKWSKQK